MSGNNKNDLKARIFAGVLAAIMIFSAVAAVFIYLVQ